MKRFVSIISLAAALLIAAPVFAQNSHGGARGGAMAHGGGFHGSTARGGGWRSGATYSGGWHGGGQVASGYGAGWHGGGWHGGGWHGGGWHGGGWHGTVIIGAPYPYVYPYAYYPAPYPVYPPVVAQGSPAYAIDAPAEYIEQSSGPDGGGDWYYCASSEAYYPNVQTCSEAWVRVPQ